MSRLQRGRTRSGLTGLLDLPGYSAKFEVSIFKWQTRLTGATRERRGRGGGVYKTVRWTFSSGTIGCSGKMILQGWPLPDAWKGQTGTITVQVASDRTVAYPVIVLGAGMDFAYEKDDEPNVVFSCEVTGAPTYTGWAGTQTPATDPSKSTQEQWMGSSKVYDPSGLLTRAQRLLDVWGTLTDTDAAEQTLIVTTISTSTPFTTPHNLKLRTRSWQKDALDGGTVVEQWTLTTPDEDAINAATERDVDPDGLDDQEATAAFNGTPPAFTDTTLQELPTSYKEFNDSMILRRKRGSRATTKQRIQNTGTATNDDPDDFGITASIRLVESNATISAPAAPHGILIGWELQPLYNANGGYAGRWIKTYNYGTSTRKQLIEQEGRGELDSSSMTDVDIQTLTATSSTAPSAPSPRITGLVLTRLIAVKLQNTPEKWKFTYIFEWMTTLQKTELRGTSSSANTLGIIAPPSTAPTIDLDVTTVLSSDTTQSLVQASVATAQAITTRPFKSIHMSKYHPLKAIARTETPGDDFLIFEGTPSLSEKHLAVSASGANVVVWDAVARTGSKSRVYLGHFTHHVVRWPIILRRWRRTTSPMSLKYNSGVGCKCGDTGSGAVPGAVTLSGTAISSVATGTAGSGYTTGAVGVVVVGGGGSGAIITATTSTTSGVTGYVVVNGGTGYTSTPTIYVTGGATFLGVPCGCVVYRGATARYNLHEEGVAHWVCIDYAFEVVAISSSGTLVDGNLSNGSVPMDAWVDSASAVPTIGSTPAATSIRSGYVAGTITAATGFGAFFGQ